MGRPSRHRWRSPQSKARRRWRDNVFVERLWRSVKYEEGSLRAYDSISAARQGVGRYLTFYNQTRPHRALDGKTPEEVYCDNLTARLTAA